VKEGVETTNMPPWKLALTDNEIYKVVFYVQTLATTQDYNAKWAPQYTDSFARSLKISASSGFTSLGTNPVAALIVLSAIVLWDLKFNHLKIILEKTKLRNLSFFSFRRTT
jgi:hypothetical protein